FEVLWISAALAYVFAMILGVQLDRRVGLMSWREAFMFPGALSFVVMLAALFPGLIEEHIPAMFGFELLPIGHIALTLIIYVWISLSMVGAWVARVVEKLPAGRFLSPFLIYLVGYGPLLCAITADSYIKE